MWLVGNLKNPQNKERPLERMCSPCSARVEFKRRKDRVSSRVLILQKLAQLSSIMVAMHLKDFIVVKGKLYYRGGRGGIMARALAMAEAKEELQHVLKLSCGDNDVSLYRRLQRQGYYWPERDKEALSYNLPTRNAKSLLRNPSSYNQSETATLFGLFPTSNFVEQSLKRKENQEKVLEVLNLWKKAKYLGEVSTSHLFSALQITK